MTSETKLKQGSDEKQEHQFEQNLYDKEFLITEYAQTGEEFRYRDKLLHNSYYLLIIASILIIGNSVREFRDGDLLTLGVIGIIGGLGFLLIGTIILNHFIKRKSAGSRRTQIEQYAEGIQDDPVQRPLGIQFWVVGNNSRITEQELEKGNSFRDEMRNFRENIHSARSVAFLVFALGTLQLFFGAMLVLGLLKI